MGLISVVLPVFNEQLDYLDSCIASVLGQTYTDTEVIVIDDSTDSRVVDYLAGVAEADKRVVYLHDGQRLGFVASLNKGLSVAKGDYVARVDSDDIQKPDRFDLQVAFLKANQNVGIVGSSFVKIDCDGAVIGRRHYPPCPRLVRQMMLRNAIAHGTVMMRKKTVHELGCYDETFEKAEDYELWMRAIKRGVILANIEEPLVYCRISNVDKRDSTNWQNNLKVKLQYFAPDHITYRVAGIVLVGLMLALPVSLKKVFYSIYNRIA